MQPNLSFAVTIDYESVRARKLVYPWNTEERSESQAGNTGSLRLSVIGETLTGTLLKVSGPLTLTLGSGITKSRYVRASRTSNDVPKRGVRALGSLLPLRGSEDQRPNVRNSTCAH